MENKAKKEPLKPVYYLYGDDDFIAEQALAAIRKDALGGGGFDSMNLHVFEGKTLDAGEAVSAALTMPAFSERRLIVIKGAESIKAAQEKALIEYIKSPCPTACLVFVSFAKKPGSTDFFKCLAEKGFMRQCSQLGGRELITWIKKEVHANGKTIGDGAAQRLVNIAGTRLRDIKGELEKIMLYAGDKKTIDEADVDGAGIDLKEETVFALSDAIGEKDARLALRVLSKLSGEDGLMILGAVTRQIRVLVKARGLMAKRVPEQAMAGRLGVPPYFVGKYVKSARRFTGAELLKAMDLLSCADMELKSGRIPDGVVLSNLIMELCR